MNPGVSGLILACILIINPSTLLCRELTGTVFSDHSGPSAKGTGVVQLSTRVGLVSIQYQKPIEQDFADKRCSEVGAIWTVQTRPLLGVDELVRAHCVGNVETEVHSAWMAVRNFIKTVATAAGQELGYQPNRRGPVNVKMGEVQTDLAGYLNFGSTGMCLEMKQRVDAKTIIIASSADCFFFPELDFRV